MNTPNNLDTLKRKVYLAYHQDGILDLLAAAILLGFSTFMATGSIIFLILGAIIAAQYMLIKNLVTVPRFGYVRFEPQEKSLARLWFSLGLGVLAFVGIMAFTTWERSLSGASDIRSWLQQYHMVPLSTLLFGLPALAAGMFFGLKRFFLYAVLLISLPALAAWQNIETFIPILTSGLIILVWGFGLLYTFVKKYPVEK